MTGYELYKRVCALLGYHYTDKDSDNAAGTAFCGMINQIAEDLKISEIKSLADKIEVGLNKREALIYGCAMLYATSLKDSGCVKMFSQLYTSKRGKALNETDIRDDILPKPVVGGM